ncbi:MAG: winged helix-turn-helix domain-containing protein [Betaproteobacteria bacterium]
MAGYYISFGVRRGRFLLILLASLEELGGLATKEEVISFIRRRNFLDLSARSLEYTKTSREPRWENELSWARKDALEHGYLRRGSSHGSWELSDKGKQRLDGFRDRLRTGRSKLRSSRLLTPEFVSWFSGRL